MRRVRRCWCLGFVAVLVAVLVRALFYRCEAAEPAVGPGLWFNAVGESDDRLAVCDD